MITFGLNLIGWGSCVVLSHIFDWTVNHLLLRVFFVVGGFSHTVASYPVLRKRKYVSSFKEWFKQAFDVKHSIFTYACVLLFVAIYYLLGCIINGVDIMSFFWYHLKKSKKAWYCRALWTRWYHPFILLNYYRCLLAPKLTEILP